ncbi:MAG: translocation/assembly module TamB domain-containing protein [Steroidobacteraceae bacterium]
MDQAATDTPSAPPPRRRRLLRWLLAAPVLLLVLLAGMVWWASTDSSLPRVLQLAQRLLPQEQQLEFSDASGSITGGGRIGHLRWRSAGIELTLEDLRLEWSPSRLVDHLLYVRRLHARNVRLRLTPQPQKPDAAPFRMPEEVSLPLRVRLPLAVTRLQVDTVDAAGVASTQVIDGIAAGYAYDGRQHALRLQSLRHGQSSVQADLLLHATDLAVTGRVDAALRNLVAEAPLAMRAQLALSGSLAGGDAASLDVQLDLREQEREPAARLHAEAALHPWRAQPLQQLVLEAEALDAHVFQAAAPVTAFAGRASVQPVAGSPAAWDISLDFTNAAPGPLDHGRLPLERLLADGRVTPQRWRAENLSLQLGGGEAHLQGEFNPEAQSLEVRGELQRLPLQQIHGQLAASAAATLSGTLAAHGDLRRGVAFDADIAGYTPGGAPARGAWEIRAIKAGGTWSPSRLALDSVHVDALGARIDGSGIEAALPALDSIKGQVKAVAPGLALAADARMQARTGDGSLSLQLASAQQLMAWLRGLPAIGEHLPDLQARGSATLRADWQGGWQQWRDGLENPGAHAPLHAAVSAQLQSLYLELPAAAGEPPATFGAQHLELRLQGNPAAAELAIEGDLDARDARAVLDAQLRMRQTAANAAAPQWNVEVARLASSVTLPGQPEPWQLQVNEGLQITARTGGILEIGASAGEATLTPPRSVSPAGDALRLAWQPLQWQRAADGASRLSSSGTVSGLRPGWLDALLAPLGSAPLAEAGLYTDLVVNGGWDVRLADSLDVRAHLQRDSGDLWLGQPDIDSAADNSADKTAQSAERVRREGVAAGIRTLEVKAQSEGNAVTLSLDWNTERAGQITANVRTTLARQAGGWTLPDAAPLSGTLQARLQDLGVWGFLAPPGWRVQGALQADVAIAGTVQSPQLQGSIDADGLNIRSVLDGVDLHDGLLRATLQGSRLQVSELTLQGGTGSRAHVRGLSGNRTPPPTERGRMTASGSIDWSGAASAEPDDSGIALDFTTRLQKMQVLVRNDRQLSLSGDLAASLQQGRLKVRGDLAVDRAAIMLPEAGAPTLGDDVVVVHDADLQPGAATAPQAHAELQTAKPMDLAIKLDLGRDLALQGYGITTRLEGELTVSSATGGADPFRIVGEVRTDEGRFRAWGQALNVETGVVLFNGPYSNPSLNLLAIRPEIAVRAGVRVTGTLDAPRVLLYSEPDMPESEKLSWVVLGRAAASNGAEGASMQQAALGLLAGSVGSSLAGGLGLDELGVSESGVSVGKRISDQLYVTYQAGLSGATSTFYIFYDITRRFTARGQTGKASALDLIYTITYD